MKINRQSQDLHLSDTDCTWVDKQLVERDICMLYHQLSDYSNMMGDLYFGSVYSLPYWECLNAAWPQVEPEDKAFIQDGCLVMILAMAWDQIDGSGAYIAPYLSACRSAVDSLSPKDDRTSTLQRAVRLALEIAASPTPQESDELIDLSAWVHREYVRKYFQDIARAFDANPKVHR